MATIPKTTLFTCQYMLLFDLFSCSRVSITGLCTPLIMTAKSNHYCSSSQARGLLLLYTGVPPYNDNTRSPQRSTSAFRAQSSQGNDPLAPPDRDIHNLREPPSIRATPVPTNWVTRLLLSEPLHEQRQDVKIFELCCESVDDIDVRRILYEFLPL